MAPSAAELTIVCDFRGTGPIFVFSGGTLALVVRSRCRGVQADNRHFPIVQGLGGSPAGIGGHVMMKMMLLATAASFAMVSIAAAADLPRREPPPPYAGPIGKYPVGKYPVGKYPVGKYPAPIYTKA
jgi:hypothetical protein